MNLRLPLLLASFAIAGCPTLAQSATCGVDAQAIVFGSFNTLDGQPHDTTADVNVTCQGTGSETVSYDISLSAGSAGNFGDRKLLSGANALDYNIYRDASRSVIWGDGSSFTQTVSGGVTFSASSQEIQRHTAYARVFGNQQTAMIGVYNDVITVTLSY